MAAILKVFSIRVTYEIIRGYFSRFPQYPVSLLSNSLVQADAKLPISEVSNADFVPRQSPGTRLFDRVRFLSRRSFIRTFPLVFQLDRLRKRRERPLWQSDVRNDSIRSFMYFRSGSSHGSSPRRIVPRAFPIPFKGNRNAETVSIV